ncbi:SapC family protein [Mitsuaria sp. GD03876]|uniref:SapC family protein n=1 Tax=Mitsuaria sp. GD03876 TaxID=2975399 RepID=UPI002446FB2E|nr:SapC family protein [Mitsuaria sp. GD03876]MDH0866728.1 SapC family protein [Mitsuaria sp. GD03876]
MSNPPMYENLVPVDRVQHKNTRMKIGAPVLDRVTPLNSLFIAVAEFADASLEYPVVFVRIGQAAEGQRPAVAPLAVFGLKQGSNLFIKNGEWTGRYVPAYVRRWPFAMARIEENGSDMALCLDTGSGAFSETEGEPLFKADGEASDLLLNAKQFCEDFEREAERTRQACDLLQELDLLQDMRFEAQLPSGEKIDVDGFMTINEKALADLPDAKIVELHRNGLLELITMHRLSLRLMSRLAQMYVPAN